jgi:hypothetical protein
MCESKSDIKMSNLLLTAKGILKIGMHLCLPSQGVTDLAQPTLAWPASTLLDLSPPVL